MDYSKIKEVRSEEDQARVNKLLRDGWVLLSVEKGSIMYGSASILVFVLGRLDTGEEKEVKQSE